VQRAGRCARFPGEVGEVVVYPLPEGGQPWLPYRETDVAHALQALKDFGDRTLDPSAASELVEAAHAQTDSADLGDGWSERQREQLRRVQRAAALRLTTSVSDLIRRDDGQTIRVVLAHEPYRLNPYAVEGFGLRRWTLARLFDAAARPIGWRWTPADDQEWTPLQASGDLASAFAVCLHPNVAAYDAASGLRLGEPGDAASPLRERPERRGARYARETWANHARMVGEEAAGRVARAGSVLLDGLAAPPWELTESLLATAARAIGVLHDVGKLQRGWQDWAVRAQRSRDASYSHTELLAHTDLDRENLADRELERAVDAEGRRPAHAAASAYYGMKALLARLNVVTDEVDATLFAACLAAILAHHGGGLASRGKDPGIQSLAPKAGDALQAAGDDGALALALAPLDSPLAPRLLLDSLTQPVVDDLGVGGEWWPVTAYLTRTLRLADQRATSLYGKEE
ncbi:MAG: hypothetical protein IT307_00960, partial [Chloroflexi bacterium]|nr:hypothetical protein [Chloroflexota bacterium]